MPGGVSHISDAHLRAIANKQRGAAQAHLSAAQSTQATVEGCGNLGKTMTAMVGHATEQAGVARRNASRMHFSAGTTEQLASTRTADDNTVATQTANVQINYLAH